MKWMVFGLMMIIGGIGFSQVYGDLGISKREVVKDCDRAISASAQEGQIFIAISVNIDGKVTSVELDDERSTVTHIVLVREAKMRAQKMFFKDGYEYPKFHQGVIEFTVTKREN
jgi:hypothetical protein